MKEESKVENNILKKIINWSNFGNIVKTKNITIGLITIIILTNIANILIINLNIINEFVTIIYRIFKLEILINTIIKYLFIFIVQVLSILIYNKFCPNIIHKSKDFDKYKEETLSSNDRIKIQNFLVESGLVFNTTPQWTDIDQLKSEYWNVLNISKFPLIFSLFFFYISSTVWLYLPFLGRLFNVITYNIFQ